MLEINPLVVTKNGELRCLDAKINFDSNALYRHAEIVKLRDLTEEDEKEIEASKYDLNYIALEGTIGCMVNWRRPRDGNYGYHQAVRRNAANFLDVGGGATKEKVRCGVQDHHLGPKRQRHPREYLWRHHALRCCRGRRCCCGARSWFDSAARGAARRHQC